MQNAEPVNCHFCICVGSSPLKNVNNHWDRGVPDREMQNRRHFWTRTWSSRLISVSRHRDRGGSWSRNAELSSLLDMAPFLGWETGKRAEWREERRGKREGRGVRVEEREQRGERAERRGEERRGEERRESRGDKRERSHERRKWMSADLNFLIGVPDWCDALGVIIVAMYVSSVCIRVRGSYQDFSLGPSASADLSPGRLLRGRSCRQLGQLPLLGDGCPAVPVARRGPCCPSTVPATACCTAITNKPLHRHAQADVAARRRAGGARQVRTDEVAQESMHPVVPVPAHLSTQNHEALRVASATPKKKPISFRRFCWGAAIASGGRHQSFSVFQICEFHPCPTLCTMLSRLVLGSSMAPTFRP